MLCRWLALMAQMVDQIINSVVYVKLSSQP